MKVKNKKTGEVCILEIPYPQEDIADEALVIDTSGCVADRFSSVAELYEEWEDYKEEPKRHWIIDTMNDFIADYDVPIDSPFNREIGNYFETKEEAEKAVEKLKAWKRLKDKGFKFKSWKTNEGIVHIETSFNAWDDINRKTIEDIDTLFGSNDEETWVL